MADNENFRGYFRSQREEARRQREVRDIIRERSLREAGGELTEEEERAYQEAIEARSFGTYQVTPLPNRPELYGKGPSKSTRLSAHKFVPGQRINDSTGLGITKGLGSINSGTVYVRFNRPSKAQGGPEATVVYKYTNVPVAVYESFRNNGSKGRFINNPLNTYNPTRVMEGDSEFSLYCSDL